jgi:prepilin-type processing-associated H-X9-DG protein
MDYRGTGEMLLGVREFNTYSSGYPSGDGCPVGPFSFQPGKLDEKCSMFHYWSLHPGGAHFLFADGRATLLRYPAAGVLPALASRAGREQVQLPD